MGKKKEAAVSGPEVTTLEGFRALAERTAKLDLDYLQRVINQEADIAEVKEGYAGDLKEREAEIKLALAALVDFARKTPSVWSEVKSIELASAVASFSRNPVHVEPKASSKKSEERIIKALQLLGGGLAKKFLTVPDPVLDRQALLLARRAKSPDLDKLAALGVSYAQDSTFALAHKAEVQQKHDGKPSKRVLSVTVAESDVVEPLEASENEAAG